MITQRPVPTGDTVNVGEVPVTETMPVQSPRTVKGPVKLLSVNVTATGDDVTLGNWTAAGEARTGAGFALSGAFVGSEVGTGVGDAPPLGI